MPGATAVGGSVRFPSLNSVANLFRSSINDTQNNTTGYGTGSGTTAGLIMPDSNPDLLTFMDSAIRDTYSDLRNIGDPALLLDNYILTGIPALTQSNPAVQVGLNYAGYYNGFTWSSQWKLPIGMTKLERMWERWSGTESDFIPMNPAPFGLPGTVQWQRMNYWEIRQDTVWMPGCLVPVDLRLRCRITFPDKGQFNPSTVNFDTTYIPIADCQNAVVAKMLCLYARRFAPELKPMADADDEKYIFKLRQETVKAMQNTEYQRASFGDEATASYGWLASL
jgi:hypothetical protein